MSFFDTAIQQDTALAFLDADGFGAESVVYTKPGGATRTIKAIVNRTPPENYQGVQAGVAELLVANNSTTGISSAEIDFGGDSITLAVDIGKSAVMYGIHKPRDGQNWQDAGMLRLLLR